MSDREYYGKDWMSDEDWECAEFLAQFYQGFHHVPGEFKRAGKASVSLEVNQLSLATFDFNEMTRLVVLAHDKCIRFGVNGPHMVEREYDGNVYEQATMMIVVSKRKRGGSMFERHPTLDEAVAQIRKQYKSTP